MLSFGFAEKLPCTSILQVRVGFAILPQGWHPVSMPLCGSDAKDIAVMLSFVALFIDAMDHPLRFANGCFCI